MADTKNTIEATRKYIPVKIEKPFLNIVKQTRGTRCNEYYTLEIV
jgi:hypothetical protein